MKGVFHFSSSYNWTAYLVNRSLKIYLIARDIYVSAKERSVFLVEHSLLRHTPVHNLTADLDCD